MPICPSCGRDNPDGFRFCGFCTAPLQGVEAQTDETRKVVTVVFADVTGSTDLGERLDPESLRRVMTRYFEEMRRVLERHGGTVEKFIGDAVMAVFGVPALHEDDALRAVRAAAEMREALVALNQDLERERAVSLRVRTGVNTGEVVAGDPASGQTLATGDAVNVAARLEQAAAPGEILLGPDTQRLVRDAVEAEPVEPLALKGKARPMPAFRLLSVKEGAEAVHRRLDSPLVGRDRELSLLRLAFDGAADSRTCHLATVIGAAGVGKSRLVEEFLRTLPDAAVVRGRCLPYGEGITFWPVTEIVHQAAGIDEHDSPEDAVRKIAALVEDMDGGEVIAQRVAQAIGLVADSAVPEETFWGIRRLLEGLARDRPLVVVLDDIHWAEPTLLELIEHVADWSRGAPILLLCPARHELLDLRPGWGGGKLNATSILLEPLSEEDCEALIVNLLGSADVAADVRRRIAEAAEGNPLFVEEMFSMLVDDGILRRDDGRWVLSGDLSSVDVPPTTHALIAARLDRLGDEERAVIQRASVVGRVFYRGAVTELSPEPMRPAVPDILASLVRRELVRPHPSDLGREESYRFRHLLIQDGAYEAMPKEVRADLHERFADWLERTAGERVREVEEILAHHLERVHRYRSELGPLDDRARALGERAGRLLASAGRRANVRGDASGASTLLSRAVDLLPAEDPARIAILADLADNLLETGDFHRAVQLVDQVRAAAKETEDRKLDLRARAIGLFARTAIETDQTGWGLREAQEIVAEAEALGDPRVLVTVLRPLAWHQFWTGRAAEGLATAQRILAIAREEDGLEREVADAYRVQSSAQIWGPTPVDQMLAWGRRVIEDRTGTAIEAYAQGVVAMAHAMRGEPEEAEAATGRAVEILREFGAAVMLASAHVPGLVRLLLDDPVRAEAALRPGLQILERMGERGFLSTTAAMLGEALYRQGRDDQAEEQARRCEELAAPDDKASQIGWRLVRAGVLARRGRSREAERLAREAVALVRETDHVFDLGQALQMLAEVLLAAGDREGSRAAAEEALATHERKGNRVMAARAHALLAQG